MITETLATTLALIEGWSNRSLFGADCVCVVVESFWGGGVLHLFGRELYEWMETNSMFQRAAEGVLKTQKPGLP